ncbi:hypothetical protein AB0B44_36215, partial [Streptomyces sp. NPDC041003]
GPLRASPSASPNASSRWPQQSGTTTRPDSRSHVYFALAGYTEDARTRADDLGIPLFVMDLTGMPQPVNDPADELVGSGA